MLPCVLLTPDIFSSLHTFILPSLSPSFLSQFGSEFVLAGHTTGSPRTPGRNVIQQSGAKACLDIKHQASNLRGVNLNIAVSCRLPRSLERARVKRKKAPGIFILYLQKALGGMWPYWCLIRPLNSRLVCGEKVRRMSKLVHVRKLPCCLQISSFSRSTRHVWGQFLCHKSVVKAGFPMHRFICCRLTTNRFPQLIYYWRLLCCMQSFPLVDYVCCFLSCTVNTNMLWTFWKTQRKYWTRPQTWGLSLDALRPRLNVETHCMPNECKHTNKQSHTIM